jgi:ankyrin repeat protein
MVIRDLHSACENGDVEAVTELLGKGADPNARDQFGQTPLHIAVDSEIDGMWQTTHSLECLDFAIAKLLVIHGASLTAEDSNGETPIDWVVRYGEEAMAAFERQVLAECQNAT